MIQSKPKNYMVGHPIRVEPTERWIRAQFNGEFIANSRNAAVLLEYGPGKLPGYFFPQDDVRLDLLKPSSSENKDGTIVYWDVYVGDKLSKRAGWSYLDPPEGKTELKDLITLTWFKMDHWYEEEEEVFVHARDPYKRVDVMHSSRHVRIDINGQTVAETDRPYLLFETDLPTRYYIPAEDVHLDLLELTSTVTQCPYKGVASYWTAKINGVETKDVIWCYQDPIPENPKIKGLMAFFNERVDMWVDGEKQARPLTPWS